VEDRDRSVDDTPTPRNCSEFSPSTPCAGASRGHRTLLPTHRLRWEGTEKQEGPDRELARGVRPVAVGGTGWLVRLIGCHHAITEGLLVLIPSRAPHLISPPADAPLWPTAVVVAWVAQGAGALVTRARASNPGSTSRLLHGAQRPVSTPSRDVPEEVDSSTPLRGRACHGLGGFSGLVPPAHVP
jgi:hypothetical protein